MAARRQLARSEQNKTITQRPALFSHCSHSYLVGPAAEQQSIERKQPPSVLPTRRGRPVMHVSAFIASNKAMVIGLARTFLAPLVQSIALV